MKTFKQIVDYKNFILLLSFVSATILSFAIISPAIAENKQEINTHKNCVNTILPSNEEREITIDSDNGMIIVGYKEKNIKKEVRFNHRKDSKISECTSSSRELINLAQNISGKIDSDTCKELTEIISGVRPVPLMDDKKMDIKATNNYINKHCL